jgi:hypothetical protein
MFLLYPSLGGKIFSIFQCHTVANRRFFIGNMSYECHHGEHLSLVTLSIIGMIVYVLGIPMFTYYVLRKNRKYLYGKGPEHQRVHDLYGSLYSQYLEEYWYWEIIEMIRKVFLCGGLIAIASGTSLQILIALIVQFIYLLIIERAMPYKEFHDDIVQFVGSIQLFFTLLAGLILRLQDGHPDEQMTEDETNGIGNLLVILNLGIIFAGIFSLYMATPSGKERFKRYQNKNDNSSVMGEGNGNKVKVHPSSIVNKEKEASLTTVAPQPPPPPPSKVKAENAWSIEE